MFFNNISFRYVTRKQVFKDFNLKLKREEITAIVGESGCGKTTLLSLLQNLYPLSSGEIKIGQIDIQSIDRYSLRRVIGVIPQHIHLFSGNIIENIALGETDPNILRIKKLSVRLGITNFVEKFRDGFETQIGEFGVFLSGGQKQRIAIARAILRDAPILFLDEATSALDPSTRRQVQRALHDENGQRTLVTVTHDLASVRDYDQIIVLQDGKQLEEYAQHFSENSSIRIVQPSC